MRYVLAIIAAVCITGAVHAQVRISLNVNVDRQPVWGPAGYDHVEYYYLPDIDAYYCVPRHVFFYNEGGRWTSRASLPSRYHGFDLYHAHKVVMNEASPYRNNKMHREQYASMKAHHDQQPIRDSRETKYFVNKNHPEHNAWMKQHHERGNGNGRDHKPGRN